MLIPLRQNSSLAELRMTEKTVYKYFPTKEALALAMYEKYYRAANEKMAALRCKVQGDGLSALLHVYYEAKSMTRNETFNKYKLNDIIRSYTAEQNDCLWESVSSAFHDVLSTTEISTVRIIIDGTFEKICERQGSPDAVIERLVKLI